MDGEDDRQAGRIRKRRFSAARIQPTRIKKVMQSDEDIGRMIASVPVALGCAMEHFSKNLLESAAKCVQNGSARTLTPSHIRFAILKNRHFSFLEELTKDIPTPRAEEIVQSSTSKTPTSAGFSPAFDQQNFPSSFPQQMISAYDLNADLNANTSSSHSQQRPVKFSKEHEAKLLKMQQTSSNEQKFKSPTVVKPFVDGQTGEKRKRGRPRKERKDKFVEGELTLSTTSTTTNGSSPQDQMATTPEELDRIRMPPPNWRPVREAVNNENSAEPNCTSTSSSSNQTTSNSSTKTSLAAV